MGINFGSLFGRPWKATRRNKPPKPQTARGLGPGVESLEDRTVPYNVGDPWGTNTITYSYSNLLDGSLRNTTGGYLNPGDLAIATREAMGVWSSVAALAFVAQTDSGPGPTNHDYDRAGHPTIRWGHHYIDGTPSPNVLAHGEFPGGDGEDGDIHFDSGNVWSVNQFLSVAAHELGHAVGMEHANGDADDNPPPFPAIMHAVLGGGGTWAYNGLGTSYLLPDDIAGVRALYGAGLGYVLDHAGVMHVYGTQGDDTFTVFSSGGNIQITNSATGGTLNRSLAGIRGIAVYGRGGNDLFNVIKTGGVSLTISGDAGSDHFRVAGTAGGDVFVNGGTNAGGAPGNDQVVVDVNGLTASVTDVIVGSGPTRVFYNLDNGVEGFSLAGNAQTNLTVAATPPLLRTLSDIGTVTVQRMSQRLDLIRPGKVVVGANGVTSGITGQVHIERGTYVDLTIDDRAGTTPRSITLTRDRVTGLPGTVSWTDNVLFSSLQVSGGRGGFVNGFAKGNTFTVTNTPAARVRLNTGEGADLVRVAATSGPLEVHGQNGQDVVGLGQGRAHAFAGSVTVTNALSYSAVTVDDSLDTQDRTVIVYRQDNGPYNVISGLSPAGDVLLRGADLSSLTLRTGDAGNTFRIHDTPVSGVAGGLTTTIRTGGGSDTVTVNGTSGGLALDVQGGLNSVTVGSTAAGLDRIQGRVGLAGTGGFNGVALNDQATAAGRPLSHTITATSYTRTGAARVDLADVSGLSLLAGAATDTVNVQGNPTPGGFSRFEVQTGGGEDTVNVGTAARRLAGVGSVTIDAGAPSFGDVLNIIDDGSAVPTTYTFDLEFGSAAAPVFTSPDATVRYGNAEVVNFAGGSGGNEVRARGLPAASVTVNPGAGDDLVEVGTAAGLLGAIRSLRIDDAGGTDHVVLRDDGQDAPRSYSRDASRLVARPLSAAGPVATVSAFGVEAATLYAGAAADLIRIASTVGWPLTVDAGGGDDEFYVGSYSFYDIFTDTTHPADTLDRIANPVHLDGQEGADTVTFHDEGNAVGQTYFVSPSSVRRSNTAAVSHGGVEAVTLNGTAADDIFRVSPGGDGAAVPAHTLNGNGGVNTLDYSGDGEPPAGLVNWYQAEGDFVDAADGTSGTPYNGVAFAAGQAGEAFSFDGVDDYIDLGHGPAQNFPGSLTFEAWVNYQEYQNGTGYKYLFGDFDAGGAVSQGSLGLLGARVFWYQTMTDGTAIQPTGGTDLVPGQWYHVAVVRDDDAKTVTLYVNGVEDATESYAGTVVDLQSTRVLGTSLPSGFPNDFFQGRIDEASLYGRALTPDEVSARYAAGAASGTGVVVNLVLGTATAFAGGISGIQNVVGTAGNDTLVGNGGNVLRGGLGRDLLIAGPAASTLLGGGGDDILVGGATAWDSDADALAAILAVWATDADYASRVETLRAGYLSPDWVLGNGGGNTLNGEDGDDLFFGAIDLDATDADGQETMHGI